MFSPRFKVTNPLNKQKLLATHTRQAASSTYTLDNHITMHSVSYNSENGFYLKLTKIKN